MVLEILELGNPTECHSYHWIALGSKRTHLTCPTVRSFAGSTVRSSVSREHRTDSAIVKGSSSYSYFVPIFFPATVPLYQRLSWNPEHISSQQACSPCRGLMAIFSFPSWNRYCHPWFCAILAAIWYSKLQLHLSPCLTASLSLYPWNYKGTLCKLTSSTLYTPDSSYSNLLPSSFLSIHLHTLWNISSLPGHCEELLQDSPEEMCNPPLGRKHTRPTLSLLPHVLWNSL